MLQRLGDILKRVFGEIIPENQNSHPRFIELVNMAQKEIWVVAGELNPIFYDENFVNVVEEKVIKNGLKLHLLFAKGVDTEGNKLNTQEEVIAKLKSENVPIVDIFKKYPNNIEMYRANRRPKYHFNLFDDEWAFLEKPHPPYKPRKVYIKQDKKLVEKYIKTFNTMSDTTNTESGIIVKKLEPADFN